MSADLPKPTDWLKRIAGIRDKNTAGEAMLEAFRLQYIHNEVYRKFCDLIGRTPGNVSLVHSIPYLPISFFKSDQVRSWQGDAMGYFQSSGTTGAEVSKHFYHDLLLYDACCIKGFEDRYGSLNDRCILALLPSYLEQGNSSLVYMVNKWMEKSGHPLNGFFLHNTSELKQRLTMLEDQKQPTLLIGVTYALLDLAHQFPMRLRSTMIMETGGMKGRKREMVREEVHEILKNSFQVDVVHSEYGMTELFSQAYADAHGIFQTPHWMKVSMREEDDPLGEDRMSGVIYVADLANLYSCCFIATADQGRMYTDGRFEVLGRIDQSDIRGCSLMYTGNPS